MAQDFYKSSVVLHEKDSDRYFATEWWYSGEKSYVEIHKASDKGKKGGVTTLYIAEMRFITLKGQREVIPEIVGVRH